MEKTVSVIIPTYNSCETIERALNSVITQTFQPYEIIVVDDNSFDNTTSKVNKYIHRLKSNILKLIKLDSNHGPGYARNVGWNYALGNFIAFLDSDDSWHPKKLELQIKYMTENSDIAFTGHNYLKLQNIYTISDLPDKWCVKPIINWKLLLFSCSLITPSVMLRRNISFRFNPNQRFLEDRLLWLQILLNGYKAKYIDLPLAYTHKASIGEKGLSSNIWQMRKGELETYSQLKKMGCISGLQEKMLKSFSLLKHLRSLFISRSTSNVI